MFVPLAPRRRGHRIKRLAAGCKGQFHLFSLPPIQSRRGRPRVISNPGTFVTFLKMRRKSYGFHEVGPVVCARAAVIARGSPYGWFFRQNRRWRRTLRWVATRLFHGDFLRPSGRISGRERPDSGCHGRRPADLASKDCSPGTGCPCVVRSGSRYGAWPGRVPEYLRGFVPVGMLLDPRHGFHSSWNPDGSGRRRT